MLSVLVDNWTSSLANTVLRTSVQSPSKNRTVNRQKQENGWFFKKWIISITLNEEQSQPNMTFWWYVLVWPIWLVQPWGTKTRKTQVHSITILFCWAEIRQSKINSPRSLGRWDKWIVNQASDVPSIIFFHDFLQNFLQKSFQFIFLSFY